MAIGAIVGLASAFGSGLGGILGNKASRKAARLAQKIADMNATAIERQAIDVIFRSNEAVRSNYYGGAQVREGLAVVQARAGLTEFGSPGRAVAALAGDVARNAEIIRHNARNEVTALNRQAEIVRKGGQVAAGNLQGQGIAQLFAGASNAVTTLSNTFSTQRRPLARSGGNQAGSGFRVGRAFV